MSRLPQLISSRGVAVWQPRQVIFLFWLLGFFLISNIAAAATPADTQDLSGADWQYFWGDVDIDDPKLQNPENWQPIAFPASPPDRNGQSYVWFRTTLPEGHYHNPVFYVTSIDLTVAAYIDGEKIYQFGEVTADKSPSFKGWPWHAMPLPDDLAGKTLSLKIFSDYTDIGMWGDIWIIDKSMLQLHLLRGGVDDLIIAAFSVLLALMALLFACMRQNSQDFMYLGLFALATAGTIIGEALSAQLVFNAPLLKRYIAAFSYFAMPIFLAMLLSHWCQARDRQWFLSLAWMHGIYWVVALTLSLTQLANLAVFYPMFDLLLLFSATVMLLIVRRHFSMLSREQKLVMLAFVLLAMFLLVDMLIAHSVVPWIDFPMELGALLFTMIVASVSLHHYKQMQDKLHEMNQLLERRVAERTESLQAYADREIERSQQLAQMNKYSLELEELISALQTSVNLHEAGLMVCEQLPKILSPREIRVEIVSSNLKPVDPEITRYFIEVEDIQGLITPFIYIDCLERNKTDNEETKQLMDQFGRRVVERLQITLSSIKLRESLQIMSFEDALTGLKNRRYFDEALQREQQIALRSDSPLALLICDIDHFKRFNDLHGHDAGDMALRTVANIMLEHFRETDIPCRFGGEEFVVLMPGASPEDALNRAEALLTKVADKKISYQGKVLDAITVSIGIASLQGQTTEINSLLLAADKALYRAKQNGRNQVIVSNDLDTPNQLHA